MTGHIRVSPDRMRACAKQMHREANRMEEVIARLDSLLGSLQGEWEGAACDSFSSAYQEIKPGFRTMEEYIHELAAELDTYANRFEELDAALA